jgi:hypothetical protein
MVTRCELGDFEGLEDGAVKAAIKTPFSQVAQDILPDTLLVWVQGETDARTIAPAGWLCEDYDENRVGEYTAAPVLPDGYYLQDGLTLPSVTVKTGVYFDTDVPYRGYIVTVDPQVSQNRVSLFEEQNGITPIADDTYAAQNAEDIQTGFGWENVTAVEPDYLVSLWRTPTTRIIRT